YLLAFHDSASLPAGQIGVTSGYALANVDTVNIDVKGLGGHGAYPQNTKDPIVLASRIVVALQTLVSRENDPLQPAVVTVGSFHAGTKSNIIPDDAKLALTVRSYSPETRKLLLDGIARIARGEAIAAALAAQSAVGARRGRGDLDRDRGNDRRGAGHIEEGLTRGNSNARTDLILERHVNAARAQAQPFGCPGDPLLSQSAQRNHFAYDR